MSKNILYDVDDDGSYEDEEGLQDCPKCGREYDEIDQDYEICSWCGWNVQENKYNGKITKEEPLW